MNYTSEALSDLIIIANQSWRHGRGMDGVAAREIIKLLHRAEKFVIPPPERVKITANAGAMKWLKAPYPVYLVEYPITNPVDWGNNPDLQCTRSGKRIALIVAIRDDNPFSMAAKRFLEGKNGVRGDELLVMSIYWADEAAMWLPVPSAAVVEPSYLGMNEITNVSWVDSHFEFFTIPVLPGVHKQLIDYYTAETGSVERGVEMARASVFNDLGEEVVSAIRFTLLLNTKNVRAVKVNEVSPKLNRKREANGKPPLFSYHTISLFLNAPTRVVRRMDAGQIKSLFARQTALHTVMGHIKVRKTGPFWWRPFVRGDRGSGIVEKDYIAKDKS